MRYKKLFSSLCINNKTLKNRIILPPMADFGMTNVDGYINQRHLEHYQKIAQSGTGMIIIEACAVSKLNEPRNTINIYDNANIQGLSLLAQTIHNYDSIAIVQIMNTGLKAMKENAISEISYSQFLKYKEDFKLAAWRCKKAGFDGVEIHAAHGMYINEIIETSLRNDKYGGSFQNRIRVLIELIEEIKALCGTDFIVGVRIGNRDLDKLILSCQMIEKAGVDFIDISTGLNGSYNAPDNFYFDDKIYAASIVKRNVKVPVIGVGHITDGIEAEKILENNYIDLVAVGRGQLCDPQWTRKVKTNKKINKCLNCKICQWYRDGRKCPVRVRYE